MALIWSEERMPCPRCRYNHVVAETPFGPLYIEWKGWKDYPSYDCSFYWTKDHTHFVGDSLEEIKGLVQDGWSKMVSVLQELEE